MGRTSPAILARWLHYKTVIESLVGSFQMIMILEFLAKDVHVLVAKYYKMVEAFLLYESLDDDNVLGERLEV